VLIQVIAGRHLPDQAQAALIAAFHGQRVGVFHRQELRLQHRPAKGSRAGRVQSLVLRQGGAGKQQREQQAGAQQRGATRSCRCEAMEWVRGLLHKVTFIRSLFAWDLLQAHIVPRRRWLIATM
jgi:hypothetical protein